MHNIIIFYNLWIKNKFYGLIKKHYHVVALVMLFLFFFPLLWISKYNFPSGDDFSIFLKAVKLGTIGATKFWYFSFSGKYSSYFIQSLFTQYSTWLIAYKIIPVFLFLFGFSCLYFFLKSCFCSDISNKTILTFNCISFTILVSFTPDIATGFYWLPSSITYLGAVFTTFLIVSLHINIKKNCTILTKIFMLILVFILIGFLAGLNELSFLFYGLLLGSHICFLFFYYKKFNKIDLVIFGVSLLFGCISFFAPGNFIRDEVIGSETNKIEILAGAISLTFYLIIELFTTTPILLIVIIYFIFLKVNFSKLNHFFSLFTNLKWHWVLIVLLFVITLVNYIFFSITGVNSLTIRIKNIYTYYLVVFCFFFFTILFSNLMLHKVNWQLPKFVTAILVVSIYLFIVTGNELVLSRKNIVLGSNLTQKCFSLINTKSIFVNAYIDLLSGRAKIFSNQNDDRVEKIKNSNDTCIKIPLYSYVPKTIFIQDANHPFGSPNNFIMMVKGRYQCFEFKETGPPPQLKEKF